MGGRVLPKTPETTLALALVENMKQVTEQVVPRYQGKPSTPTTRVNFETECNQSLERSSPGALQHIAYEAGPEGAAVKYGPTAKSELGEKAIRALQTAEKDAARWAAIPGGNRHRAPIR